MSHARAAIALLLLLAACGADDAGAPNGGSGGTGGTPQPPLALRPGGPIANAGPDQRALAGMPVYLDSLSSMAGEEGLPIARRWTQEAGPRVMLDDPTAADASFVAPPTLAAGGTRLVFLLTVDDGARTSTDRMVVELVDRPSDVLPAPIAVAGPDLQVQPGAAVELQAPFTLDPACLDEGGAAGCELEPIPTRFVQVEGPPVALQDRHFVAPGYDAVLTFRLDGHRRAASERLDGCAPGGAIDPPSFCSAPDFVRVLVIDGGFDRPPAATFRSPLELPELGGLLRVGPDPAAYAPVTIHGNPTDPDGEKENPDARYRPLLESLPEGKVLFDYRIILNPRSLRRDNTTVIAAWPRTVAVALEARSRRLFSAPAVAAVRWEAPANGPTADAGTNPCHAPLCTPFVGGETVVLDGSGSTDPDTRAEELVYCWQQTFGPKVTFVEGDEACRTGAPTRSFVAPDAPAGGKALHLAFALTVDDGGPLLSRPDTTIVQIRPHDNLAPEVVVDAPDALDEGSTGRLDASASEDPEGRPLTFTWKQVPNGAPLADVLADAPACAQAGACFDFVAPAVTRDTTLRFEVAVADDTPLYSTQLVDVVVRNSNNDAPSADAGADRVAAPGAMVELAGSATDPNPGDEEALTWSWAVLAGGVTLEADDLPTARFVAPDVTADLDVLLELSVQDPSGATSTDQVTITILADGPYVAQTGDDLAAGTSGSPVASIERAIAIAGAHGFRQVKVGAGSFTTTTELQLDGIEIRGGHDGAWSPAGEETRLLLQEGAALGEGAALSHLSVEAPGRLQVLRVRGDAALREVVVDGASLQGGSAAVRVEAGRLVVEGGSIGGAHAGGATAGLACAGVAAVELRSVAIAGGSGAGDHVGVELAGGCEALVQGSRVVGGDGGTSSVAIRSDGLAPARIDAAIVEGEAAAVRSVGIEVAGSAAELQIMNAVVQAGAAPEAAAVSSDGETDAHSSLLRVVPYAGTTHASALRLQGDATLRNVILDAGGTAMDRAHLRLEGGASPAVLTRVLFVTDQACGGAAAYVRGPGASACSAAAIGALATGWDPRVGEPAWQDASAGDFRLGPASAAVDAGVPDGAPPLDIDGRPRGGDGNGDGVPGYDIGPFER